MGSFGRTGWHDEVKQVGPGVTVGRSGGSIGVVSYVQQDYWPLNTSLYVTDFLGNDPRFCFYWLGTLGLANFNSGSAQPSLNRNHIYELDVIVPPISEQKSIAEILSSLDEKIELNRKQNRTLEAIAQALFKRWFVEFEFPDENGRPYKSSGGAMQPSELGEIPVGWDGCLGDVVELAYGKALKEEQRESGDFPVVGSSGVVGTHTEQLVGGPGIVVGRKGNVGSVIWFDTGFYPIDTTFYVVPKLTVSAWHFLYFLLKQQNFLLIGSDSAVPGLNRNHAYQNTVVVPHVELLEEFEATCDPLFTKIKKNTQEIALLSKLRDTLLPKLMSGELRVA
jgi:type I restriction enzyme S subunit